ncbi:YvrJ family protein [Alkalihalobacterium chitinilyticum]|uniref:YvrJ family protein n=1 Tax=Alkalihalobacterium chitinilyticum TaxID=2980103 RepID=A0ABT5VEV5_9BACI|nr:YvrJ family protein [Alkalihalobacterium chitinilyticum]MDE5413989.1 YvrJ family protein [Alkalihalobacterium chitinilyticum]
MEMWLPLLSEFGFPVMVTLYLLHRVEKKLDLVNQSIERLPESLASLHYYRSSEQKKSSG